MKTSTRRNFLKKIAITAASAVAVPGLVKASENLGTAEAESAEAFPGPGGLIVPNGARRSGTPTSAT